MATDRLRKRLQDARRSDGSDAASHPPSSSENFCTFGTPLPLLSSTKRDPNEFKPVWQQEVYDDQGRRRFHGAFTGGWSAGYYNSVGSKEGWTPSSFRSSRKDKAKGQNNEQKNSGQSVEDFMDEEDMMEYRQGRGALKTQEIYNNDKQRTQQEHDPLADLLAGSRAKGAEDISSVHVHSSTLGIQILQHMGWKSGQGLGRLVSAAQRRTLQQLLGLPIDEASDHTTQYLAPPDTPVVALQAEESISRRGLGYDSTDRPATLEEILKRQRRPSSENKEAAEAGFDSDGEEVVYEADHQRRETIKGRSSSNTRWDSNERKAALVGNKVHREKNSRETEHVSELDSKREDVWHDGRRLPPGFCHAEKLSLSQPWFEAPIVPKDWSPDPQRVWSTKSQEESHNVPVKLDADQRAKVLGEARAPGPPPLITNYLNEKDHARLERANAAMPSSDASKASIHTTRSANHAERHLPHLDRQTAQSALRGYIPFGDDVEKQQRYKDYLASQADPEGARSLERQFDQSAEQFWSEVNEFAKSAAIFKPMNSMMATRFESSSTNRTAALTDLQTGQRQAGLYVPVLTRNQDSAGEKDVAERSSTDKHLEQASREDLPSLRRNARMGLFGPQTTRETKSWFPSRLLCKRFNVPYTFTEDNTNDGHGGGRTRGGASEAFDEFGQSLGKANISVPSVNARWEASKRQLQQLAASREWESHDKGRSKDDEEKAREEAGEERSQADAADLSAETDTFTTGIGFGDHTAEGEETLYVKPPADLFRAVFAEDEDQNQTTSTNEQRDEAKLLDDGIQTATPKMADDVASRPIFVPRKRVNEDEQATSALHSTSSLSMSSKTASKKKAKKQPRSMLSFSMDDDDAQ